jgi:translation initiation factor 2B subunit (eIF-2B alpha/beta/delta family)
MLLLKVNFNVCFELLLTTTKGKRFRVIVTEARPGDPVPNGYLTAERLQQAQIPGMSCTATLLPLFSIFSICTGATTVVI